MIVRWMLLLALLLPAPAPAASAEAELARFADGLKTLQARFEQVQTDESGAVLAQSRGELWLARPGRFRWAYAEPYEQLMVSDGRQLWMYEPDLRQVSVRPLDAVLNGTPAALLASDVRLDQAFQVEDRGLDPREGARVLRLTPRQPAESEFSAIELWLREGVPQRLRFEDGLGGRTEVRLSNIVSGEALPAERFRFTPPPGVELIQAGVEGG
ncbi:MAG TPA: outer membrane lipoprotein chaperone LolA [Nevskiaceae bacterium]|nr:outer membrane lipoprotein chaperone LolA [Nevskiaceae bacterium]